MSKVTADGRVCVWSEHGSCPKKAQLCGGSRAATERMIQFGRELQVLSEQLCRDYGKNTAHKKMLQVRPPAPT